MEIVGQPSPSGACNLLGVPGLSSLDVDDDEGEVVIGIRPKSSPLPRRRSSDTDDDSDLEPPLCGSRRVSFADAKGLSLVQVKEFDTWDVPKLPGYESSEGEGNDSEEYFLSPLTFSLPLPTEELYANVREHKAELETLELLPGTTILKGVIRVLNISFNKAVYIRTTLDSWSTHFDLLAEYIPGSSDGVTDCFSFRLTLVPPFEAQGARVDFCLRYETSMGTFWANNNDRNYVFSCHHKEKEERKEPQKENLNKKSCLKTVSQNFSAVESNSTNGDPSEENNSADVPTNVQKVQTIPTSQTCKDQSRTSQGREQTLLMENRHSSSRRSRRKAARLARVRHYFAQRGAEGNDSERDESPPGSSQAAAEKVPEEKQTVVRLEFERNQAGGSPIVSDSLERRSELLQDDASPSHDTESVKPESIRRVDSDLEPGGDPEIKDKLLLLDNEPKEPNINEAVTESEEIKPDQDVGDGRANDTVDLSSDNLVSQMECFTFGTVVAPLYQQVFGRVGSDSQRKADWGNPAWAAVMDGDSNPPSEREQNNCTDPTDETSKNSKVDRSVEADHTTIDPTLNYDPHKEQTSLNVAVNGVMDCIETLAEIEEQEDKSTSHVSKPVPGDSCGLPQTGKILSDKNQLNSQKPPEIKHLQGEVVEEEEILKLQSQTTAERRQHQMPKNTDALTGTDNDESHDATMSLCSSVVPSRPLQSVSEQNIEELNQQTNTRGENNYKSKDLNETKCCCSTGISSKTSLIDDRFIDVTHDMNSNQTVTEETASPCESASELVEEKDLTTLEKSVETHRETNNLEKENKEACSSNGDEINPSDDIKLLGKVDETTTDTDEIHGDVMLVMCEDKHTINEHSAMETAESKQDENLTDDAAVQNWEAMVEEEENYIILSEEENETQSIKTENVKQIEEVTAEEEDKVTEEEFVGKITFVGVKEEEEVRSEEKEWIEREETVEAEEKRGVKILSDCVPITKNVRTAGEEKPADVEKTEIPGKKEKSRDKSYNNCFLEEPNFPKDQDIDVKGETEMNSNNKVVAGVQWEDQVEPKEENDEQESAYYKEEIVVVDGLDGADSYTPLKDGEPDVESEEEEGLDITISTVEGGQEVIIEKEYKEVKNEQIQMGTFLHEEEKEFQTNSDVIRDLTKAESSFTAADWNASFLTDEPENDQTDQDGVSTESDSDDEVELYMHCLRAVSAGAQAQKDRNNDTGFSAGKRPSISRSKRLSTPMPSISESMDEEQQLSGLVESHEDAGAHSASTSASALTVSSGQQGVNPTIPWWKDTFSSSNISKTLLYTTLLVVFLVVAYYYDFLACFVLYFISVVWLYCQGERQPAKNNNRVE